MALFKNNKNPHYSFLFLAAFIWTTLNVFNYFSETKEIRNKTYDLALIEARNIFFNDVIYRKWVSIEGGVYVEVSDYTSPNPYLNVKNRDVVTTNGMKLTLVNPAYMTRMVHELRNKIDGVRSHITSLKPLNPKNSPDEWERKALLKFENGEMEFSSIESSNKAKFLRFMAPFITESECLKCHAHQGYKVGDVRGGISVSVPLRKYDKIIASHERDELIQSFIVWILGLAGLFTYFKISLKYSKKIEIEKDKLDRILKSTPNAVIIHKDDKILYANKSALKLFKVTDSFDIGSITVSSIIHPNYAELSKQIITTVMKRKMQTAAQNLKIICFDGEEKDIEVKAIPFDYEGENSVLVIARDVTKQLYLENQLEQERNLFTQGPIVSIIWGNGAGWKIDFISKNCNELLGFSAEEIVRDNIDYSEFIHPDDRNRILSEVSLYTSNFIDYYEQDYRVIKKNGNCIFVHDVTRINRDEDEKILSFHGYIFDQTNLVEAKEKLMKSEEKFRMIFEYSPDAISLSSIEDGKYYEINKAFEKMCEFSHDEIIGKTSIDLGFWINVQDRNLFIEKIKHQGAVNKYELQFRIKSGKIITCYVTTDIIEIQNKKFLLSIIEDKTEEKLLELRTKKEKERALLIAEMHRKSMDCSEKELLDFISDSLIKLTESKISFAHKYDESTGTIILTTWDSSTREICAAQFETHYPLESAGNWADCVRQKKSIIYNDFKNSPNQKGLPIGHVNIEKFMSIPAIIKGKVKLIFGIGNKVNDYNESDAENVEIIINELAKILEKKALEKEIRQREIEITSLLNAQTTYIIKTDLEGSYTFCNSKFYETFSWLFDDGKILGKNALLTIAPEDHQACIETVEKCVQNPEEIFRVELRKPQHNDIQLFTMWDFVCKLGDDGNPKEILCIGVDITEKKYAEKQLESQLKFTNALNQIFDITLSETEHEVILSKINSIIRETLEIDRSLIYNIDSDNKLIIGLVEALNSDEIEPTIGTYPLEVFQSSFEFLKNQKEILISHFDDIHPSLLEDNSADLLHNSMKIKSLIWLPFNFNGDDFSALVLNSVKNKKVWTNDEILFLQNFVSQITYSFQKLNLSKNLIDSEMKFRKIFEQHSAIKLIIDMQTEKINDANEAAEKYFMYDKIKLENLNVFEAEILPIEMKNIFNNRNNHFVSISKLANGDYRNVEFSIGYFMMMGREFTHLILTDITEKVKKDEELRKYKEHLEDLIYERTQKLEFLNAELSEKLRYEFELEEKLKLSLGKEKEINEMKTRFIATVSHEFRTPLSAMLSSVQLIKKYSKSWSVEKLQEHYVQIDQKVKYLTQLLDDILTISRAEREVMTFNPDYVISKRFFDSILSDIKTTDGNKHHFNFEYNLAEEKILIDEKLMRHTLVNLLGNAVKYSPEKSSIYLFINETEEELIIKIKDEGMGISNEEIKFIFEPFYRTINSVGIPGSGLGLNIVKRCVELMNGRIQVESSEGKGSIFEVIIPKI